MKRVKFECCHADTCLPDYWSGHHLPHLQIPVYNRMKLKEIKEQLKNELSYGAVMGSTDNARLLSADMVEPNEEKQADKVTKAAYAAINRLKLANPKKRKLFTDLEPETEDGEIVYAYFVFVEIQTSNK